MAYRDIIYESQYMEGRVAGQRLISLTMLRSKNLANGRSAKNGGQVLGAESLPQARRNSQCIFQGYIKVWADLFGRYSFKEP